MGKVGVALPPSPSMGEGCRSLAVQQPSAGWMGVISGRTGVAFLHHANLQQWRDRLFDPVNLLQNRAECHFVTHAPYLFVSETF